MQLRKVQFIKETVHAEAGERVTEPIRRVAALAVIDNPFAGRFERDLSPLFDIGLSLGEELMPEAARLVPGLTPDAEAMAAENARPLREKEGIETDHGILLSHILACPDSGLHLCHAMLLPRPEALELLPRLEKDGAVDLGLTHVGRMGKASVVEFRSLKTLNALDDAVVPPLEIAVDLDDDLARRLSKARVKSAGLTVISVEVEHPHVGMFACQSVQLVAAAIAAPIVHEDDLIRAGA